MDTDLLVTDTKHTINRVMMTPLPRPILRGGPLGASHPMTIDHRGLSRIGEGQGEQEGSEDEVGEARIGGQVRGKSKKGVK